MTLSVRPSLAWPGLLFTTTQALCHRLGVNVVVVERKGSYYGLTWDGTLIYVARHTINEGDVIDVFDRRLKRVTEIPSPGTYVHQLLFHAGKLYAACTEEDRVAVWDRNEWRTVYAVPDVTLRGLAHVNSIWFGPDGALYVCEHWRTGDPAGGRRSRIAVSRDGKTTYIGDVGACAHNVYVENGTLHVFDSANGKLTLIYLATGARRQIDIDEFPRGFARTKNWFVFGSSDYAERADRKSAGARLHLYDKAYRRHATVDLVGVGAVHGVRVLGEPDAAHNGIPLTLEA